MRGDTSAATSSVQCVVTMDTVEALALQGWARLLQLHMHACLCVLGFCAALHKPPGTLPTDSHCALHSACVLVLARPGLAWQAVRAQERGSQGGGGGAGGAPGAAAAAARHALAGRPGY